MPETIHSILFPDLTDPPGAWPAFPPECFSDLNLDQVVDAIAAARPGREVRPYFWRPLTALDAVRYRQDVMRDLSQPPVRDAVETFSARMQLVQRNLAHAQQRDHAHERARWFLDAAREYCDATTALSAALLALPLHSDGLGTFREWLAEYGRTPRFADLATDVAAARSALDSVAYHLILRDGAVTVSGTQDEADFTAVVERTFEKFRRDAARDYRVKFPETTGLNWVEGEILTRVAWLAPDVFEQLRRFGEQHAGFVDATLARFDAEVQFYLAYLNFLDPLQQAGIRFTLPELTLVAGNIEIAGAVDLALAAKANTRKTPIVPNDVALHGTERIIVVTGPNHGGKTTFARMIGQLHYLAALGCPVPAARARLLLVDGLFTHFERRESVSSLRGKLQDDLTRVRDILERATSRSLVIMNEAFSSTTLDDARFLSTRVLDRLDRRDLVAVVVTFIEELSRRNEHTVSYVASVDVHDPSARTFAITRRPADGLAYAAAIAEKYRVTYQWLTQRLADHDAQRGA